MLWQHPPTDTRNVPLAWEEAACSGHPLSHPLVLVPLLGLTQNLTDLSWETGWDGGRLDRKLSFCMERTQIKYSSLAVLVLATGQEGERFNCVPTFRGGGESQQGPSSTHQLGWDGCDPAHRGVTTILCFHSAQRL